MNATQKIVILNNEQNEGFKAILNLKSKEKCSVRFFNLSSTLKNLALGIKQLSSIQKVPLVVKNGSSEFELNNSFDLSQPLTCAVLDVSNAFCPQILLSGSAKNLAENEIIENAFVQTKPQNTAVLYGQDSDEALENLIDKNLKEDLTASYFDACAECRYRKAFYDFEENSSGNGDRPQNCSLHQNVLLEQQSFEMPNDLKKDELLDALQDASTRVVESAKKIEKEVDSHESVVKNNESEQEELDQNSSNEFQPKDEKSSPIFFDQVVDQIDALFKKYEKEPSLENVIPNSKWVKVDFDLNGGFYVLGLICDENDEVLYIAYGIPATVGSPAPDDLKDFAQFVQTSSDGGFFVVCQDAKNGKTLACKLV